MAWNEPGKPKPDPMNNQRKPDAPPDLDEVLKELHKKLRGLFGSQKPASSGNASATPPSSASFSYNAIISFVIIVIFLLWIAAGFFIVDPPEKAAILRFGKYVQTDEPGLHWAPPFIDSKYIVNVQQVLTFPYQAEMLTQDENIVSVDLVVQYRINNLQDYLFNVANPQESLQQATASALRQVIGQTKLDNVLTSGREMVRQQTTEVLEKTLDQYHAGIIISDVNMQPAKPPEEVTDAFDDAIKAREDEQRYKNQAVTYANRIVPVAQGDAARIEAEAQGYQQQVVLNAQAATSRYLALLPEYQRAPEVTRERMYLDTLQSILTKTPMVLMDTPQNNNSVTYLPIDKLLNKSSVNLSNSNTTTQNSTSSTPVAGSNVGADQNSNQRPDYNSSRSSDFAGQGG